MMPLASSFGAFMVWFGKMQVPWKQDHVCVVCVPSAASVQYWADTRRAPDDKLSRGKRNWFPPPKMTAWCIIWLHAVQVLDRDNLSNPTGDLIVLTRATLSTFWLCACQGSSRQDPWGKKFLCSIQILNCSLFPIFLSRPPAPSQIGKHASLFHP